MKTIRYTAIILTVVLCGAVYADQSHDAETFFRDQIAQIKGDIEQPLSVAGDVAEPTHHWCATPVMAALNMYKAQGGILPDDIQVPRPNLPYIAEGQHIVIHYTTTGADAVYQPNVDVFPNGGNGIPDFVDSVLIIFDEVHTIITGSANLGYRTPPADLNRGGNSKYDVYLVNLGAAYFGFTYPDPNNPNEYQVASFIELDNDYSGSSYQTHPLDAVKVTAAHEYYHAVQFAYDAYEFDYIIIDDPSTYKPWWMEASAVWMEDVIYDDINDYIGYLPFFYNYPWMGLGTFSYLAGPRAFHPYASGVWPIYLTEKHDIDILRRIWERCSTPAGYNTLTATNEILGNISNDLTLSKAFLEFAVWNYSTGSRANTSQFYSEGDSYPLIETVGGINNLTEIHAQFGGLGEDPEHLAANYFTIQAGTSIGGVGVSFDGEDYPEAEWHTAILGYRGSESRWRDMFLATGSGAGTGEFLNWNSYESIVVIPTVSGLRPIYEEQNGFSYTGEVWYDSTLYGDEDQNPSFNIISAYPAPFSISDENSRMTIEYSLDKNYITGERILLVYDLSGSIVYEIDIPNPYKGAHSDGVWNGQNQDGKYVASGIYILHMEAGSSSSSYKVAVINSYK